MAEIYRPLSTSEINDKLVQQQTGQMPTVPEAPKLSSASQVATPDVPDYSKYRTRDEILRGVTGSLVSSPGETVNTKEAAQQGFGHSRYDSTYYRGMDIENSRALNQSNFAKIGSGLMKGGITAATTALETTVGTVYGLGSSLFELGSQVIDPEKKLDAGKILSAGVNNDVSSALVKMQTLQEEWFPNYRTAEERSEQYQKEWWKHMGTANFIGDSFLKNFGFTVGAMAGGVAWTSGMNYFVKKRLANDLLKASLLASEGNADAKTILGEVVNAVRVNNLEAIDATKLAVSIQEAAKAVNKADALLQVMGSAVGALGEGTMEGLMAKDEFLQDFTKETDEYYFNKQSKIEQEIIAEGDRRFVDPNGVVIDDNGYMHNKPVLTKQGQDELRRRSALISKDREDAMATAEQEGEKLASFVFALNLPVLTSSNLIQFGRMFSGGWKTARKAASKVATKGLNISKVKDAVTKYIKPVIEGNYAGVGNKVIKGAFNALKVAGSEAFEEMAQGTISSGGKSVVEGRLAEFVNSGYDPDAIGEFRDWFGANFVKGASDYLSDVKNWQEGALGAITGLVGMPGRVWQKGNRWHGGIYGAIQDAAKEVNASRDAAEKLNTLVNSKAFQDRWHSYIRHLSYDNAMQRAVTDDDQYAWQNANDAQLASDVIAFAKAGRLDDLLQIADAYSTISPANAGALQEALKDDANYEKSPMGDIRNMSDTDVVKKVKEQAEKIKETIGEYKDVYDSLVARMPLNTDDDVLDEMLFSTMMIKAYEQRFFRMLDETLGVANTALNAIASYRRGDSGQMEKIEDAKEVTARLEQLKNGYASIYSKIVDPVKMSDEMLQNLYSDLDRLEFAVKGDKETEKKLSDMRRLMNERRDYYKKLVYLQTPAGQKAHSESKMTQDKLDEASNKEMSDIETQGLNSLDDVRRAYNEKKDIPSRQGFVSDLQKVRDDNKAIDAFLRILDASQKFDSYVTTAGWSAPSTVGGGATGLTAAAYLPQLNGKYLSILAHEAADRAQNSQEFLDLPDSVIMSRDEFIDRVSRGAHPADPSMYDMYVDALRNTMRKYRGVKATTSPIENMSAEPAPASPFIPMSGGRDSAPSPFSIYVPNGETPTSNSPEQQERVMDTEVPVSEKLGTNPVAENPTDDELARDARLIDDVTKPKDVTKAKVDGKVAYIRPATPEIDSFEARDFRNGDKTREEADLGNFYRPEVKDAEGKVIVEANNPEYEDTWTAVSDNRGFEAIATKVEIGDDIEFGIDPNFPPYNNEPQILMYLNKNGQRTFLNTLGFNTRDTQYLGLRELRDAIMSEYRKFEDKTQPFYFSKMSTVWTKQPGVFVYGEEKSLRDAGYEEGVSDGAILYVDKDANLRTVKGDKKAQTKIVSGAQINDKYNRQRGALYYLANTGEGEYVPLRLSVEKFNEATKADSRPVYQEIRSLIETMVDKVHELGEDDADVKKLQRNFYGDVGKLGQLLDLHKIDINIADFGGDIGKALHIVDFSNPVDGKPHHIYRRPEQLSVPWLIDTLAGFNMALQLKQDDSGNITSDIDRLIRDGHIRTNAEALRAKGVDFYAFPWMYSERDKQWGFYAATDEQFKDVTQSIISKSGEETEEIADNSVKVKDLYVAPEEGSNVYTFPNGETPVDNLEKNDGLPKTYDDLSDMQKEALKECGFTPEEYDPENPFIRDEVLGCA